MNECKPGQEVEISYRLEYKMAEVARLPDAASFTHVTTSIGNVPDAAPSSEVAGAFTVTRESTKVTQDDQVIKFVTRVKDLPESEVLAVPVVAYYSDGKKIAAGEKPVEIAQLVVKKKK
ncbi:MAG: hypothetical protein H7066_17900 [Cytophagaceae bacterium]|nr:hypothetical protein [Gemmatimonadaceae bacterium]